MAAGALSQNIGDQIAIPRIGASRLNGKPEGDKPPVARIGISAPANQMGERKMGIRLSRVAMGVFVVAAIALLPGLCWAVYYGLGPSKDEWGLKYDVAVSEADGDKITVAFTLADEGRLKPFHSLEVVAFSRPDSQGGRSIDVKAPIALKPTQDGKQIGQVQIPKKFADQAKVRILTLTVNGQRQSSASFYDIPLQKYLKKSSTTALPMASPPTSKVSR